MQRSLTQGPITRNMLLFALPLMCGNLLQQMYNIADTWVVGRFLGADALAAVGSSYTLMTFLTSIVLGLCMGSGAAISMQYGGGEEARMRQACSSPLPSLRASHWQSTCWFIWASTAFCGCCGSRWRSAR